MTIAIAGILAAIAVPSFKYVTASNRIASEVNGLLGDMQYARTEAVKEGMPITVCASSNGTSCAANSTNWALGWIAFADSNGNHFVDAGESVLRTRPAFTGTDTFVADNGFGWATFNRGGFASTGTGNIATVKLQSANHTAQWTRCLTVSPVGMVGTEKSGTGAC